MERCSECRFNQEGYCQVYQQKVNSDEKACEEFEEK